MLSCLLRWVRNNPAPIATVCAAFIGLGGMSLNGLWMKSDKLESQGCTRAGCTSKKQLYVETTIKITNKSKYCSSSPITVKVTPADVQIVGDGQKVTADSECCYIRVNPIPKKTCAELTIRCVQSGRKITTIPHIVWVQSEYSGNIRHSPAVDPRGESIVTLDDLSKILELLEVAQSDSATLAGAN